MNRTVSVKSILDNESRLWLNGIHRRLAGRVGVRRPYFCEIIAFMSLRTCLKEEKTEYGMFRVEPDCYFSRNKKADVISITKIHVVLKLFSCVPMTEVKQYFKRTLTSMTRYNHKVKVIASATKDFGFVYKHKSGQLLIHFYFSKWNYHGNAQHFR